MERREETIDIGEVEAALSRAAYTALHGTPKQRSGRFRPQRQQRQRLPRSSIIFDDAWLASVKNSSDSWVVDVLDEYESAGQKYLSTLRSWFEEFPLTAKQKNQLFEQLESPQIDQHLGAVNQLAWWAYMCRDGLVGKPLPASTAARPDFRVEQPVDCFVEVSTVNLSDVERRAILMNALVPVDHAESVSLNYDVSVERFLGIARKDEREGITRKNEKYEQLIYAASQDAPAVLAIFDYKESSGYGLPFFHCLGDALLGPRLEYKNQPRELSAIVYLERQVRDGRIALNLERSAVYHNPFALHPLPQGTFRSLKEFSVRAAPVSKGDAWFWLS